MSCLPPSLVANSVAPKTIRRSWLGIFGDWVAESRSHRVILLVLGIWLLNAFDLILTVLSHQQGILEEGNPVGRWMLGLGIPSLVLFKLGLVMIGSYPLLRFRRARITELAAYVILISYAILAVHWSECYELYASALFDKVNLAEMTTTQLFER